MKTIKQTLFAFLLLITSCVAFSQKKSRSNIIRIIFPDFDSVAIFIPKENLVYQEIFNGKGEYLKVRLYNKQGKSFVEHYSKDSLLICSGLYASNMKIYSRSVQALNIQNSKYEKLVILYYCPKRTGSWTYFDKQKNIINRVQY